MRQSNNSYKIDDIHCLTKINKSRFNSYEDASKLVSCCNFKNIDDLYINLKDSDINTCTQGLDLLLCVSYCIMLYNPYELSSCRESISNHVKNLVYNIDSYSIKKMVHYGCPVGDVSTLRNTLKLLVTVDYTLLDENTSSDYYIWEIKGFIEYDKPIFIENTNLRKSILLALGYLNDYTINDNSIIHGYNLYSADMLKLTSLNIYNYSISSFVGLEYCSNLKSLSWTFDNMNLYKGIFSGLEMLNYLTLIPASNNICSGIHDIPDGIFDNLINLKDLNLSFNSIYDLRSLKSFINNNPDCVLTAKNQSIILDTNDPLYTDYVIVEDDCISLSLDFLKDIDGNSLDASSFDSNGDVDSNIVTWNMDTSIMKINFSHSFSNKSIFSGSIIIIPPIKS